MRESVIFFSLAQREIRDKFRVLTEFKPNKVLRESHKKQRDEKSKTKNVPPQRVGARRELFILGGYGVQWVSLRTPSALFHPLYSHFTLYSLSLLYFSTLLSTPLPYTLYLVI